MGHPPFCQADKSNVTAVVFGMMKADSLGDMGAKFKRERNFELTGN